MNPPLGSEGEDLRSKNVLLCCCIRDSLKFDWQHDDILKKWNFDLKNPPQGQGGEG